MNAEKFNVIPDLYTTIANDLEGDKLQPVLELAIMAPEFEFICNTL